MIENRRRPRVLFLCGGCTRRSPMAGALAAAVLADGAHVESAGVAARFSKRADPRAVKAMREHHGLDIRQHSPRDVRDLDRSCYDLLVALDHTVADELRTRFGVSPSKLFEAGIPDPYVEGTHTAYRATATAVPALVSDVRRALERLPEANENDNASCARLQCPTARSAGTR